MLHYGITLVATKQDIQGQIAALLGEVKRDIDVSRARRIFCNRNLKMASIELIGFDMDYTLALYQQDRLEKLSIQLTLKKLIENHGYPPDIQDLVYDPRLAIRGLVIDRNLGNVFKMDRHGYVGRVFHGLTQLSKQERNLAYRRMRIRLSSPRYAWIDTLFGLPEAVMYMTLVDHFERTGRELSPRKLFDDIRASIDEAHRDDTLKTVIKAEMPSYVIKDPRLAETLHKLRSSGKKLFLLTNSLYDYSNAVMSYLLDGERKAYPSWRNYFDAIIVGASKPAFFTEKRPFMLVDPATGQATDAKVKAFSRERIYQGGNIFDFENMTNVRGDRVLYVGDHIYGDMIRLKKVHTWRTAMVLQELDLETRTSERLAEQIRDLELLDRRRRNLESEIDYQVTMLKQLQRVQEDSDPVLRGELEEVVRQAKQTLDSLRARARTIEEEVEALEGSIDRAYNPHWGPIFREGHETSRFGSQVSEYADLYTSRVSNFLSYSPLRYFRAARQQMPHEM
ncbi:MAG TPA: HAD-IG family 5'-nucleotidase [Kofleriaceae bacterium]|nr:HAD-IG family 5'-nucleotidase [Kofleriaceae bacterium]